MRSLALPWTARVFLAAALSLMAHYFSDDLAVAALHAQCHPKQRGQSALAEVQAQLPLLRPLLSSGSLRSVLEAAVAAARLPAPSAAGSAAGRQARGTRQHDEDAGWKRVQHSKKTKQCE